jgi:4-alpha-glucanotransferase
MRFPTFKHPVTGTTIPVGALRTAHGCGIGEFPDLVPFAEFCAVSGIDLIQLLPVNDTGTESSPYSALSAFALHPIYLRIGDLPEAGPFASDIAKLADKHEYRKRFSYRELRHEKTALLRAIFEANEKNIVSSEELARWIDANPWIVEYAVFKNLKRRNFEASWKSWDKMRSPSHAEIKERWDSVAKRGEHLFHAWVQMRLDEQFSSAVAACEKLGVAIKGDIPIMMNEDSCDAWANPEFFRDDLRAGSPPDGMNPLGQNWGFPIYNWDNLRALDFSWWKDRLRHASKYYHAYRIDHILGFFRIWSIPSRECTGYLGWPTPHTPITQAELAERGFSGDRLRWICEPHVPTRAIEETNGFDYRAAHETLSRVMDRIGDEELWLFKREIRGEKDIREATLPDAAKETLARRWRDRMMQDTAHDAHGKPLYEAIWNFRDTTAWASLSGEEKDSLESLIRAKAAEDDVLWEAQANELLDALASSVDMLPCAEDLGSIPACVPSTLERLGILSLKVVRWERRWEEAGQPFRDPTLFPELSVATTSVHDSSTLRGWWEEEDGARDFLSFWQPERLGYPDGTSDRFRARYSPEAAAFALSSVAKTSSNLFVIPIQDFLALSGDYYRDASDDERVNVPGSVTEFNWTYRLPEKIEELKENKQLIAAILSVLKERRSRPANKGKGR